jgi:hypothetical protein
MTLKQLRDIVNETFEVNIEIHTRKRHTSYAKKVYCCIAKGLDRYSLERIGECMNMPHDNVIYHLKTVGKIYNLHKIGYNDIIVKYGLDMPLLEVSKSNIVMPVVSKEIEHKNIPNYILSHLQEYSEDDLLELFQTRLKPFKMLLDTRRKQKEIKNIIGAKIIR